MGLAAYTTRIDTMLARTDLPSEVADLLGDFYDVLEALNDVYTAPPWDQPTGREVEVLLWDTLGLDGAPAV